MRRYWYAYTGSGNEIDPSNYLQVPWSPKFICLGGSAVCAIYSRPNAVNPDLPTVLSKNLVSYLTAAKALLDKYPNNGLAKPYVYTRPIVG